MQEQILQLLKDINIGQLVSMGVMFWFFYSRLDKKISDLRIEMKDMRVEIKKDIGVLSEKVEDVDRRLCRIEGSLATQGHCLFNQAHKEKNVG